MNKISGVYKVTNKLTGDFYIGSSKDIKDRWANHKCCSAWKYQPNSKLYKDMAKYGLDNFLFEIIEETNHLKDREQYWIDELKPSYNNSRAKGHNVERYKETGRKCSKVYHQAHRDKVLAYKNASNNRLCLYEDETLTFAALSTRFSRQGIPHPTLEAKKYLI